MPTRRAVADAVVADAVHEMSFLATSLSALKAGAVAVALWTVAGFGSVTAQAEEPTAAGLWEKVDAFGQPEAWFRIVDCGGTYEGQIVKMFPKPGEPDPSQWRCTNCQGEQKNAPVLGITFIKGMQRYGLTYENGTILDPRDGSLYSARMKLCPEGNQLTVRGYLASRCLGKARLGDGFRSFACGVPRADPVNPSPG
jgi:uncharacterized protein (DUF2147 family)